MDAKLVIVDGERTGEEIQLEFPMVIGRSRGVGITIAHPLVSRQHCELVERDGKLVVRDLGSLNGTFIGETRITEEVLPPGALMTVGQVIFRAVYGDVTPDADSEDQAPQDFLTTDKAKETAAIVETIEVKVPADSKTPTPQALMSGAASTKMDAAQAAKKTAPKEKRKKKQKKSEPEFDFRKFSDKPQEVAAEDDDLNDFLKNLG